MHQPHSVLQDHKKKHGLGYTNAVLDRQRIKRNLVLQQTIFEPDLPARFFLPLVSLLKEYKNKK